MSGIKPIILVIIAACIGLGYYAWQQQNRSLKELERLKSVADISFSIVSRPILAVDKGARKLFLLGGSGRQSAKELSFNDISQIKFIETPYISNKETDPRGPDSIIITLNSGETLRVGDLPDPAADVLTNFQHQGFPSNKLSLKSR